MPEKFDMILSPDNPSYKNLPGIWILIGAGVWIGHFAYWGFNQCSWHNLKLVVCLDIEIILPMD